MALMLGFISGASTLAKTIFDIWSGFKDRKQKVLDREHDAIQRQLDREHQDRLQQAQHEHELQIEERRKTNLYPLLPVESVVTGLDSPYIRRLYVDAYQLSQKGFEIIFEPMDGCYGLALPLEDGSIIAFILPENYPLVPPSILLKENDKIDQIGFDEADWVPEFFLSDIVDAVAQSGNRMEVL